MDQATIYEQTKFRRMFTFRQYKEHSPGIDVAPEAFLELRLRRGDSIIDYGCGIGDAVRYFRDRNLFARGVDLLDLFPAAIIAPLWDLPDSLEPSDFAFCVNVLECLPPDKLDAALSSIAQRTIKAGFFQISTVPDTLGRLIGKKLHQVVQPMGWWQHKLLQHFSFVKLGPCAGNDSSFWAHVR